MTWRWGSAVAVVLALTAAPGCSDRACLRLAAGTASCPARSEALKQMTPSCGGAVIAVTSDGERDGDTCCYDVVERDVDGDAPIACGRPNPTPTTTTTTTAASSSVTSTGVGAASSSSSSGVGGVGGGGAGGQGAGCDVDGRACAPACDALEVSPSAGSCVSVGGVVECNPVTNEGCDTAAGEACDVTPSGFACYPAPNIEDICQACGGDGSSYCKAGYTCFGSCFRYCCKSSDCGTGVCYTKPFPSSLVTEVGVCIDLGAGGAGGAG